MCSIYRAGEQQHKVFWADLIKTVVGMATESSHWLLMGKMVSPPFLCCFLSDFFKLAGNEDRQKILDKFEFRPDRITPYRVRCPWASKKLPSHRLIMGNGVSKLAHSFLIRIFKFAGEQDRHKISDKLEFRPIRICHFGVMRPWGQIRFSIDLPWTLQDQLANIDQILYVLSVGWGKGCFKLLEQIPSKQWLPWQQKAPIDL